MKNLFSFFFCVGLQIIFINVLPSRLTAQVTLERAYEHIIIDGNSSYGLIDYALVDSEEVMYYRKRYGDTVEIYNLDHSLYKSVILSIRGFQPGKRIDYVGHMTRHLFNTDNKIEFIASAYPGTYIFNENGDSLFFKDSVVPHFIPGTQHKLDAVFNTSDGAKMLLYNSYASYVYGLPGTVPQTSKSFVDEHPMLTDNIAVNAYANPANGQVRLVYKLPPGATTGDIVITTIDGKEVKCIPVGSAFEDIVLSTSDISSGTYFYRLAAEGKQSKNRKLIISH